MSGSKKVGLPISDIPVGGFDHRSKLSKDGSFRDQTVQEMKKKQVELGYMPDHCGKKKNDWICTRPESHFENGESGMHIAGNGSYVVAAW